MCLNFKDKREKRDRSHAAGLSQRLQDESRGALPRGVGPSAADVFCTVRQHMSDAPEKSQAAVLLLPAVFTRDARSWIGTLTGTGLDDAVEHLTYFRTDLWIKALPNHWSEVGPAFGKGKIRVKF